MVSFASWSTAAQSLIPFQSGFITGLSDECLKISSHSSAHALPMLSNGTLACQYGKYRAGYDVEIEFLNIMTKAAPPPPPPLPGLLESIKNWGITPPSQVAAPTSSSAWDLMARPEVNGLYYRNQHLMIDGYKFINCRFDNCVLETKNGNFDIVSCVIDSSNQLKYGSESRKAIQLFTSRYDWARNLLPSAFVGHTQPDGTITITSGS